MILLKYLPGKIKDEKIIMILRRDFFILLKKIFYFLVLILLPYIFYILFINSNPVLLSGNVSFPLIVLGISSYFLFIWLFFFFSFIDYYLDVWIITNERIIDIQQKGFFSRVISEQRHYRIQDVTSEVNGIIATVLKYGNVYVQTAGSKQRFFFHEVPNPEEVRNTIIRLAERSKRKYNLEK
jgi:membrane protein YdbS with pleckstrin-like domain